ncbi:TetR/AcrR family transcriptional regulator [Aestuariivita sp.]|jgi:AcrR family transcriptional regulator|uniref:TetR/AcrR family transcriptional regulator n=1 Tax=Aestuariivita sp. TaxID=1872407 RepID=UPI002173F943|nr:TetR/AcrR family transcriptional regulator [Aestuariivita sp.]MCE8006496.1 helix-turn-helix transcriptional regulator [Aestuariivita sp.]
MNLLEAGFAVLSRNPGASLADVAQAAGVGRATLHRHFSSRSDLVTALARQAMRELAEAVDTATADAESYWDGLRLAMQAVVPLAHRHMFLMRDENLSPDVEAAFAQDARELRDTIDAAKAEGAIRADLPTEGVALAYDYLIYAGWEMVRRDEATPRQAADLAWTMFAKGAAL